MQVKYYWIRNII